MTDAPDQSPVTPARALSPKWLSMTALAVSIIAMALAALPYANGGGDFGGKVRTYLLAHPELLDEVVQARDARAATDRITATNAAAMTSADASGACAARSCKKWPIAASSVHPSAVAMPNDVAKTATSAPASLDNSDSPWRGMRNSGCGCGDVHGDSNGWVFGRECAACYRLVKRR